MNEGGMVCRIFRFLDLSCENEVWCFINFIDILYEINIILICLVEVLLDLLFFDFL